MQITPRSLFTSKLIENFPISQISAEPRRPYKYLVNCIQYAYAKGLINEAKTFEWVINVMVYGLFSRPK